MRNPLPTVGRIVLVRHPSLRMGAIQAPAMIVEIHSETRIAVTAFGLFGAMVWIQSIQYNEALETTEGWTWPPRVTP